MGCWWEQVEDYLATSTFAYTHKAETLIPLNRLILIFQRLTSHPKCRTKTDHFTYAAHIPNSFGFPLHDSLPSLLGQELGLRSLGASRRPRFISSQVLKHLGACLFQISGAFHLLFEPLCTKAFSDHKVTSVYKCWQ